MPFEAIVVILLALAIAGGVGFGLGRAGLRRLGWGLAFVMLALAMGLVVAGRAAEGWEGIGHVIIAMLLAMPVALGLVLGLLASGRRRGDE